CRVVREDNVPGRFAADIKAVGPHVIEDIAIADRRAHEFKAQLFEMTFETKVRHHGSDDAGSLQSAIFLPALGNDGEQLVAIDDMAAFIHDQYAIGVTIERDANIGAHLTHFAGKSRKIRGAAVLIDIESVRIDAD